MGFRKVQCHGMVCGLVKHTQYGDPPVGVQGRVGHYFLKQHSRNQPRAGKGEQDAAGPQQFEGQQIDVLVPPGPLVELGLGRHELWRVQYDEIENAPRIPVLTQKFENIAVAEFPG